MNPTMLRKIFAVITVIILISNLILFAFRLITPLTFWVIIICGALSTYAIRRIR